MSNSDKTSDPTNTRGQAWLDISGPDCDCGHCDDESDGSDMTAMSIITESQMDDGNLMIRFRPDPDEDQNPVYPTITIEMCTTEDPTLSARILSGMIDQFDKFAPEAVQVAVERVLIGSLTDTSPAGLGSLMAAMLDGDLEGMPGESKADRKAFIVEAMDLLDGLRDKFQKTDPRG